MVDLKLTSGWRPDHLEQLATGHVQKSDDGFPQACCVHNWLDAGNRIVVEAWSKLRDDVLASAVGEPVWGEYRITDGLPAYRYHRDHHEWGKRSGSVGVDATRPKPSTCLPPEQACRGRSSPRRLPGTPRPRTRAPSGLPFSSRPRLLP